VKKTKLEELFFSQKPGRSLLQTMLADQLASVTEKQIDSIKPFKGLFEQLAKLAPSGKLPPPLLSGEEIMQILNIKPGPEIKSYQDKLREEQLNQRILTKAQAKDYLETSRQH